MDYTKKALEMHSIWGGKIDYRPKMELCDKEMLSIAYTPGVAAPCMEIAEDPSKSYDYTGKGNLVAVITDGSAVLGLGDIGPDAAMPVMEGKCVLFKAFGGVDAVPICVASNDVDEFVRTVSLIMGSFGGVNLEDISAPRCFEIERRLKEISDIPVFHDDQHGTAVVVLAALINALKIVNKDIGSIRAVCSGAGAAAVAIVKLLICMGLKDVIVCDRSGIIYEGREGLNPSKAELASVTNRGGLRGSLADAMTGTDVFIGVSSAGLVSSEMVSSMAENSIVFTLANPTPEIMPEEAQAAGAAVIGTGRSDYPNQINTVLAFPGIFRGALDVRARDINDEMKISAAQALAGLMGDQLRPDNIIPSAFDPRVRDAVASAVAEAARKTGVARL
ncbi:MAG: NADP-dependent malic enzyme [Oscillospiraceae bacterium]|nr:NADP-dependent malic enzyme [Oscillospiraceae bacterium]